MNADEHRNEILEGVPPDLLDVMPPDMWNLHWPLVTERRRQIYADIIWGLKANLTWFPRYQAYLRDHRPRTLVLWGLRDGYMPEAAGRAYLRDLPDAEIHMFDAGHWLLETHLDEATSRMATFFAI